MNKKYIYIILFSGVTIFLLIYPYTKQVASFRTNDLTWNILKEKETVNEFDNKKFKFVQKRTLSEKILQLEGTEISIEGFFKINTEFKDKLYTITETVTEVCFMCNHDEHYNIIVLDDADTKPEFNKINNDQLIKVKGIFRIKNTNDSYFVFYIENPKIDILL